MPSTLWLPSTHGDLEPKRASPQRYQERGARRCDGSGAVELQPEQPDQRLRVARRGEGAVEVGERPAHDLDALVLLGVGVAVAQAGGMEDVDELVGHAGARDVGGDPLPPHGRLADLLCELALGGLQRRLALLVEAAGGDLEEVGIVDGLARLADEVEVRVVVGNDAGGALVADDLALDLVAVGVAEAIEDERHDLALVDGAAPDVLEAAVVGAHGRRPYPESSSSS